MNETSALPALLVIDMVKDNFDERKSLPITPLAREIIGPVNRLADAFTDRRWPIVFATDAFHRQDFIFKGRMHPHSLAGTQGAEIVDELHHRPQDLWLPKPRFSAFFKTGLETILKERGVTVCAVAGIATNFCVLTTALDAVCHDFKAIMLSDCCAAASLELHRQTLALYRRNPLYPLFRICDSQRLLAELAA